MRYKLIIPLKRSKQSPKYTARGVMVGMFWAMTPFFGIQMALVVATWLITSKFFRWNFSLINGLAWTWVTNIFTLLPVFYLFFITGNLMLGVSGNISGYEQFVDVWNSSFDSTANGWGAVRHWFETMINGWGTPMLLGSVPWAIFSAWAAYVLRLKFVTDYQKRRAERRYHKDLQK